MPKIAAIVVGAGSGKRFAGNENKIFAKVEGQPLFLKALQLFINREDVCQTILAVSSQDMEQVKSKFGANLGFMGVRVVEGGAERADTVAMALAVVDEEAEFIAVHDAVRPCVAADWIDAVIAEATKSGAAIPAVALTGTIKRISSDHVIEETVPREGLWQAQTPQVFRKAVLTAAYAARGTAASADGGGNVDGGGGHLPTDDAQVVEASGHAVTVIQGDPRNIKITTPGDLTLASAILKTLPQPKPKGGPMGAFDEAKW